MLKLTRQFVVVLVVIGAFVAVGYAWKHSPAASIVTDRRGDRRFSQPSSVPAPDRLGSVDQRIGTRGNHGLSVSNVGDLIQSVMIQGLVVAGVVLIDRARRLQRRARFGSIPPDVPTTSAR